MCCAGCQLPPSIYFIHTKPFSTHRGRLQQTAQLRSRQHAGGPDLKDAVVWLLDNKERVALRCRCLDVSDTQKGGHSERSQPDLLSVRTRAATLSCDQWPQYATQTMLGRLETFPGLLRARVRRATLGLFSLYTRRSRGPANGALTRKPPFEGRKRGVLSVMVETAFD